MVKACVNCKYFLPKGKRFQADKCSHSSSKEIVVDYITGVESTYYTDAITMRSGILASFCSPDARFYEDCWPEREPVQVKEYRPTWWKAIWS